MSWGKHHGREIDVQKLLHEPDGFGAKIAELIEVRESLRLEMQILRYIIANEFVNFPAQHKTRFRYLLNGAVLRLRLHQLCSNQNIFRNRKEKT